MTETCDNCGKRRKEAAMIYDVPNDKYFCNQDCADKYNGVINGRKTKKSIY